MEEFGKGQKERGREGESEGHFLMIKALFHQEGNSLFKAEVNTLKRKIQIYKQSGEFSHTSYQLVE